MARVDLQCPCGYMFFVSDVQVKNGVKCPACMAPVKVPPGAAGKAAPKPAAKAAPPPVEDDEAVDFNALPSGGKSDSKKKLYIVGGAVAAGVIGVIVILAIIFAKPSVDYEKQAQLAEEARRKKIWEDISTTKPGEKPGTPLAADTKKAPATPADTKKPRPTDYVPMPAAPKSPTPATPAPQTPAQPATASSKTAAVALNAESVGRLRSEVLSLHPFYLNLVLTPGEKARADAIAQSGKGVAEDADYVQSLLTGGKLKSVRDEVAAIGQTLPILERESQDNLPVDKITYNDGRPPLNCRVLEEGPEIVKVSRTTTSGVGGQLPVNRNVIARLEKGGGVGAEFAKKWESAQKGSLATLVELLVWSKQNNLAGQAKMVAYTILKADPSNTQARAEAGLPADPVKHSEEMAKGGIIAYQGKHWPAKELRDKFIADGYCILEGKWYSKKDKMIVVPGLFRYERQNDKPVVFVGGQTTPAGMCHDIEIHYAKTQDVATGSVIETPEVKYLRRFYAPEMKVQLTGRIPGNIVPPRSTYDLDIRINVDEGFPPEGTVMQGELVIQVPVGVPILDASVITVAEVKAGGSITIFHSVGTGTNEKRTKLYMCDPKESGSHAIPTDLVRGTTEVNLVAVFEQTAAYNPKVERRRVRGATYKGKILMQPAQDVVHYRQVPDYKAVLFPSNSNTVEVFRLKCSVADPSPMLDKLFAAVPEILR